MNCTDTLKEATKKLHAETEVLLIPKLKTIGTEDDYAAILKMFYGFFAPVENTIAGYINDDILPDINDRRKSERILVDLDALQKNAPLQQCENLPEITDTFQALGALYVLEGSTLGGEHIARMIESNPSIKITDNSLGFFKGYGSNTMKMWDSFKDHLNDIVIDEAQAERVAESANNTFYAMKQWIVNFN